MIDENKIIEAAIKNADKYNPCRSTLDREEVCRASFANGVKWFKQAIWHDISEEPKENERIITEFRDNGVSYELDIPYDNWECYCAFNDILRWCYLSDLLPKGGDK